MYYRPDSVWMYVVSHKSGNFFFADIAGEFYLMCLSLTQSAPLDVNKPGIM